jgi:hypothetical protein
VYSLVIVNRRFCRSIPSHSAGLKSGLTSACCIPQAGFLLGLLVDPEVGGGVPQKCCLASTGPHSVIFQHVEVFIAATVRTSDSRSFLLKYVVINILIVLAKMNMCGDVCRLCCYITIIFHVYSALVSCNYWN